MYFNTIHTLRKCQLQLRRWYSSPPRTPISKILIANRGEIACRVMKTARRLGVRTVAVYSDADVNSMHVSLADEAYNIGPAASQESYLRQDRIMAVARKASCQAIHPGYGFLSENVEFAKLCQESGVIFMGPPASAIRDMGIKSTSKAIMAAAGVPIIEGYHGQEQTDRRLEEEAEKIGFPVMIKAVRGGGGKGMRIALTREVFLGQLESARREANKSFGDDAMLIEKYVNDPRHVEVQVFGDSHGNYVYLYERDCSVQRRHQKIIEEAPAPGISEELRRRLGEAAVRAAKAVGYVGAGTVEFILDRETLDFHFMEMNTRLQVEHPITEMITGTDLVEWQLLVAGGGTLPLTQDQICLRGHAFEARIYAENPSQDFMPGGGTLTRLHVPDTSSDVRVETGVREGDEVSIHYDPMIAKLVTWGTDRETALSKLRAELACYNILGLDTNVDFLLDLSSHPFFASGDVHTGFIDQHKVSLFPSHNPSDHQVVQAAVALLSSQGRQGLDQAFSPFNSRDVQLRLNHTLRRTLRLDCNQREYVLDLDCLPSDNYVIHLNGQTYNVNVKLDVVKDLVTCNIDGVIQRSRFFVSDQDSVTLYTQEGSFKFCTPEPGYKKELNGSQTGALNAAVAPMPGVVEKVMVTDGQQVQAGDPLVIIIAMKMEHVIKAPKDGVIEKVLYKTGDNVKKSAAVVKYQD